MSEQEEKYDYHRELKLEEQGSFAISLPLGYVGSKPNNQQQRLTVTMYFVIHLYVIDFYVRHVCSISRLIG
jgi:hypothetical protein